MDTHILKCAEKIPYISETRVMNLTFANLLMIKKKTNKDIENSCLNTVCKTHLYSDFFFLSVIFVDSFTSCKWN